MDDTNALLGYAQAFIEPALFALVYWFCSSC